MEMQSIIIVVHVLVSMVLIGLVLIQRGKGAEAGAAFGGGASQTVFGSRGTASFLTRLTAVMATTFFVTSLTLAYFTQQGTQKKSVTEMVMPMDPMAPGHGVTKERQTDVPMMPGPE